MGGTISTHAINASLDSKLPYDPVKDFEPITLIARVPNMLVVNPSVPAKNVQELITLLKANPGKYTFASSGDGASRQLSGELFKTMAGIEMQHMPYKGSPPALQDVVGGQVTMTFDTITTAWPLAVAGTLRALAVTTTQRSAVAPDVPTLAESGLPGFEVGSWQRVSRWPARRPKSSGVSTWRSSGF
jgi:tripartite-type tricarboxylate transporter receptor subunit TctC